MSKLKTPNDFTLMPEKIVVTLPDSDICYYKHARGYGLKGLYNGRKVNKFTNEETALKFKKCPDYKIKSSKKKSKRKSKVAKSKKNSKVAKRKSKTKSKRKSKTKSKRKSKTKSKRKSKTKSKTKSKSKKKGGAGSSTELDNNTDSDNSYENNIDLAGLF